MAYGGVELMLVGGIVDFLCVNLNGLVQLCISLYFSIYLSIYLTFFVLVFSVMFGSFQFDLVVFFVYEIV